MSVFQLQSYGIKVHLFHQHFRILVPYCGNLVEWFIFQEPCFREDFILDEASHRHGVRILLKEVKSSSLTGMVLDVRELYRKEFLKIITLKIPSSLSSTEFFKESECSISDEVFDFFNKFISTL